MTKFLTWIMLFLAIYGVFLEIRLTFFLKHLTNLTKEIRNTIIVERLKALQEMLQIGKKGGE